MASIDGKNRSTAPTSVDTKAIIQKWETAVLTAERLFRNLDNHRSRASHLGFHVFRLETTRDGTGLLAAVCDDCGEEIDRSRKRLPSLTDNLTRGIWYQMVHEAKIELKARLKATRRS